MAIEEDEAIVVEVQDGKVDGGDADHASLTFRSEGDKWKLHGNFCYSKNGRHMCQSNVWVPKSGRSSLEICVRPSRSPLSGCSGKNQKAMHETPCLHPG